MENHQGKEPIQLAVVMLCWNNLQEVQKAIEALGVGLPLDIHIWIVDNGSDPPLTIETADQNQVHVHRSDQNLGYAGGNNLGILASSSFFPAYILLLNTDVKISSSTILELLHAARSNPDKDILGPVIREEDQLYYGGRDPAIHMNSRITESSDFDYIPGTVFLCKSAVFNQVGLLDTDFFFSGEIADFCLRARKKGLKIKVLEDIEVTHLIKDDHGKPRDTLHLYYNLRNRFLLVRKHHPKRRALLFLKWLVLDVRMMVGAFLQGNLLKVRAIFWAMLDGFFGNFGNRNDRFYKNKY